MPNRNEKLLESIQLDKFPQITVNSSIGDSIAVQLHLKKMCLCKVCKSGKIKFGTDFCEASRSFHKRNRNRTDFQCRSGTND